MEEPKLKVRDIAPTAVRLQPALRHALAREAQISGNSLHAEIVLRLQRSIEGVPQGPSAIPTAEPGYANMPPALTDIERQLLTVFRRLTPEKQLALLSLLR